MSTTLMLLVTFLSARCGFGRIHTLYFNVTVYFKYGTSRGETLHGIFQRNFYVRTLGETLLV
jgi:hypothetical protein